MAFERASVKFSPKQATSPVLSISTPRYWVGSAQAHETELGNFYANMADFRQINKARVFEFFAQHCKGCKFYHVDAPGFAHVRHTSGGAQVAFDNVGYTVFYQVLDVVGAPVF